MEWLTTPPPKDKPILLLLNSYPFSTIGIWNKVAKEWCVAIHQTDMYKGEWQDDYFHGEYFESKDIKGWMNMPEATK